MLWWIVIIVLAAHCYGRIEWFALHYPENEIGSLIWAVTRSMVEILLVVAVGYVAIRTFVFVTNGELIRQIGDA